MMIDLCKSYSAIDPALIRLLKPYRVRAPLDDSCNQRKIERRISQGEWEWQ